MDDEQRTATGPRSWITTTPATYKHTCSRCGDTRTTDNRGRVPGWTLWIGYDHYGSGLEPNGNGWTKGYTCHPCTRRVELALGDWVTKDGT